MKIMKLGSVMLIFVLIIVACGKDDPNGKSDSSGSSNAAPISANAITTANADQVVLLNQLGRGHLTGMAVSADNFAVTTTDGTWHYDLVTGNETLLAPTEVEMPTFSPDGTRLAVKGTDGVIAVLDMEGEPINTIGVLGDLDRMTFSPDGGLLLTHQSSGQNGIVVGYMVESGDVALQIEGAASFAPDPNWQTVVVGMMDGGVALVDMETGEIEQRLEGHTDVVTGVAFAPDGSTVLSGSDDKTARLWDVNSGETIRVFETDSKLTGVTYAPDGTTIMTTHVFRNHVSQVWNIETGEQLHVFELEMQYVAGTQTVFGEARTGELGLWDIRTGELVVALVGHSDRTSFRAVAPDGQSVFSAATLEGVIRQWDVATGETLRVLDGFIYGNAIFGPDGQTLLRWALGAPKFRLELWDVATGATLREFVSDEPVGGASGISFTSDFSGDGRFLAAARLSGVVNIWDVATGELLHELSSESVGQVRYLAFAPDDQTIAAVAGSRGAIWDVATGDIVAEFGQSRDSQIGATALNRTGGVQVMILNGDQLELWSPELDTALELDFAKDPRDFFVFSMVPLVVAPDGHTIHSRNEDGWRLWNASSGETLQTLDIGDIQPQDITFSYDSRYLLMHASNVDSVVVVEVATGEVIQQIEVSDLTSAVWSPADHVVAAVTDDGVWLFDGLSGETLWSMELPFGYARQVIFSPTGEYFITTGFEIIYTNRGIVHVFGIGGE